MKAPYRSWVEISRQRIAANYRAIAAKVGPGVELVPVVKADAYHHGAVEVSRVLETEGARWLAVSSVEEGVHLREAGIQARILVMADFLPPEQDALFDYALTPAIHSLDKIRQLDKMAARRDQHLPVHLKIDSGMSRLGVRASSEQILAALRPVKCLQLEGLMTHFASAADYSSQQTADQVRFFDSMASQLHRAGLKPRYTHMSATTPIAYGRRQAWRNMVRPGLAIYGYVPPARGEEAPPVVLNVKPALEWKAALVEIKRIPKGSLVGYEGLFRAPKPLTVGVLSVGYADGLPHRLSNRGQLIAGGRLVNILGAVSMDLTTIDLTDVPNLQVGDSVTLLGTEGDVSIDAHQMATFAGTISYSILCGITARVHRVYV